MAKANLSASCLDPAEYPEWDSFVSSASSGSVYHLSSYLSVLSRVTGGSFRIAVVRQSEQIVAGVSLFEEPSLGGKIASSRLLLYYHGLVVADALHQEHTIELGTPPLECLENFVSSLGYLSISFHQRYPIQDLRVFVRSGWSLQLGYTYVVGLQGDILSRIDKNQRRLFRRAESKGFIVSEDEDFASFYTHHQGTHVRKGAPVYLSEDRFNRFFRELKELGLCRLFHVRDSSGKSVASQMVLQSAHPETHTVAAGALPEFLSDGTTPFLRVKVLQQLAAEGFEASDLTDALVPSVARFKRDIGAELKTCLRVSRNFSRCTPVCRLGFRLINKLNKTVGRGYYQ